jgi:hypothetical protein
VASDYTDAHTRGATGLVGIGWCEPGGIVELTPGHPVPFLGHMKPNMPDGSLHTETVGSHLTTDSAARKQQPIATGVLDYFPDALADVAHLSKVGNDKHNPGEPLHWSRGKSDDHADCIIRHMIDRGTVDTDGVLHDTKVAWRALAQLQLTIERLRAEGKY